MTKEELTSRMFRTLSTWAFTIQNNTIDIPTDSNILINTLNSTAFINLKKIGGKGQANYTNILDFVKGHNEFLQEQIKIINPDIIIFSLFYDTKTKIIWSNIFKNLIPTETINKLYIGKWYNYKVISFYHPSQHTYLNSKLIQLLFDIINSPEYLNL